MSTSDTEISKFLSYVLRHAPQEIGLELDSEGWTDYPGLSHKVCAKFGVSDADIRRVIDENAKKRFTLTGNRIRAAQGHSVDVKLELQPVAPLAVLYHGTTVDAWEKIKVSGLKPMGRTHVHLSPDIETARLVAIRRKGPHILLTVDTSTMANQGYSFLVADNGVWLTAEVPPQFLSPATEIAR
jgi:putative RNA 2'-phosphotransferase